MAAAVLIDAASDNLVKGIYACRLATERAVRRSAH
jgi:hypothetical protein